jgi:hypothetical protein
VPRRRQREIQRIPPLTPARRVADLNFFMRDYETHFRLAIPIAEAFAFAMGESDLAYTDATDEMRQVVGLLVIDKLEYAEQWRVAAEARACLASRWPECFTF